MSNKIFKYNGNDISFQLGSGDVMVNATQMAKSFGREVRQWFDNIHTHKFVHHLASHKGIRPIGEIKTSLIISNLANNYPTLIKVVKGGLNKQGTWIHEDIALEFARWLNPSFSIWCNDRIKELLKYGVTATPAMIDQLLDNPDTLITALQRLKKEREKNSKLAIENKKLKVKADFSDRVQDYDHLLDIGQSAKLLKLGYGRNTLFRKLRDLEIFFISRNEPKQSYINSGYFELREKEIVHHNTSFVVKKVLVTQKGLFYLHKKLNKNNPNYEDILSNIGKLNS